MAVSSKFPVGTITNGHFQTGCWMLRSHLHAQNKRDRLVAARHKPRCGYFPTPNHGLEAIDEMTFNKKSRRLMTSGFLRLSNSTMLPFVLIHPYHWYPAPTM